MFEFTLENTAAEAIVVSPSQALYQDLAETNEIILTREVLQRKGSLF